MSRPIAFLLVFAAIAFPLFARNSDTHKQDSEKSWDIPATASSLARWVADILFAEQPDVQTIVLSVRDDGVFLDAGSNDGVRDGQVFEIYRASHANVPEEIVGKVQVAWTREDYCFASPFGEIDLSQVSTLHFARLIRVPPTLKIVLGQSAENQDPQLGHLIDSATSLLVPRSVKVTAGDSREPAWNLLINVDTGKQSISVSLSSPGGDPAGSILLDPVSGRRFSGEALLDSGYLTGDISPYEHYLAPPGRRSVRIAAGNLIAGGAEELVVLDGSDLYVYDCSGDEPRLLNTLTLSIPLGSVVHREDAGSLELIDLDGNGLDEVCVAPPGGSRGEIWGIDGNEWASLGFLPSPAHAGASGAGAVLVGDYLDDAPALSQGSLQWFFPLSRKESIPCSLGFSPTSVAALPESGAGIPAVLAVDRYGTLHQVPPSGQAGTFDGKWGNCVGIARASSGPVALLTDPTLNADKLTILDIRNRTIVATFPHPEGPIIDIAVGDIDRDGRSEIIIAAIHPEGVRIYY